MEKQEFIRLLKASKDIDPVVHLVRQDASLIPMLFEIVETDPSALKFRAEKVIRALSEQEAGLLYPYFERMAALTASKNAFIKWGFIQSLPNLLAVDDGGKWHAAHAGYMANLQSAEVVTYNSAVGGLGKLIAKYPQYEQEILPILLEVNQHRFLYKGECSPECVNVAKGHILDCFALLYTQSSLKEEMLSFARANLDNPRKQVRLKAARFLKEYSSA